MLAVSRWELLQTPQTHRAAHGALGPPELAAGQPGRLQEGFAAWMHPAITGRMGYGWIGHRIFPKMNQNTPATEIAETRGRTDHVPAPTPRASRQVQAISVALLALGIAVAVAGYVWTTQRSGVGPQVAELQKAASVRTSEFAALQARVDEFSAGRRRLDEDMDRLAERLSQETEALGTLPARIDTIQETVERFAGAGDKVRAAWLLAEAEHYMRIANAQLGLAGEINVAQTSLGLADDTLRELNDPRLTPVRKVLARELNELKAVPRPDTEGIVLTLGSLADSLEDLPLKNSMPDTFRETPEQPAEALTGFDRAVATVRAALASLVSIRRTDDPISPLLSDAQKTVLIRSLDLELQLARLAIMRGDAGMFRRSIDAATERVADQFDPMSAEVQSALGSLKELASVRLPEELPDISGSLTLLLSLTNAGNGK
jgi:uroporphyrin-3 C-methyltransferase